MQHFLGRQGELIKNNILLKPFSLLPLLFSVVTVIVLRDLLVSVRQSILLIFLSCFKLLLSVYEYW